MASQKVVSNRVLNHGLMRTSPRLWALDSPPRVIYVAAATSNQAAAARLALKLFDAGFTVVSRWLRHDFSDRPDRMQDWARFLVYAEEWGERDLEDLEKADTLIVLANEPSTHGGYHTELGYFLGARRTNIVVVGDRPSVFYYTKDVRWALTTDKLVEWLSDPAHGRHEPPTRGIPIHADSATSGTMVADLGSLEEDLADLF